MPASRFARYAVGAVGRRRRGLAGAVLVRRVRRRASRSRSRIVALVGRRAADVRRRRHDRVAGRPAAGVRPRALRPLGSAAHPGRLARQNAVRNPSRTASTAAAVMIGLALITFVAVIGQGFRTSFTSCGRRAVRRPTTRSRPATTAVLLTNKAAQGRREGAGRRGRLGDPLGQRQGRRQDDPRHRRRRQPRRRSSTSTWTSGSDALAGEARRRRRVRHQALRRGPLAEGRLSL